ncbi:nuclear transport factor 2 family protein [Paenibacillus andongensis]|uniref:nuclear transport factor 2 family protein n=1 Tax=Paenibacillus andongensis TaxID=2975482 RepID=UPI0021BADE3B|nr:nuclear transport factor 2 family protein [Paenibacillus andongensis]
MEKFSSLNGLMIMLLSFTMSACNQAPINAVTKSPSHEVSQTAVKTEKAAAEAQTQIGSENENKEKYELPPPEARPYVDAVNNGDLDALVNSFAEEAVITDVKRQIKGWEEIRFWGKNEVMGGTLEVLENEPKPKGVRMLVHFAPKGSKGFKAYYTFEFKDGKIISADLQYA